MSTAVHIASRLRIGGWLACLVLSPVVSVDAQPYLSNLNADGTAPLFATYAAPMERSEFVIDEGYHFQYYDVEAGLDFTTDTAGSMRLVFGRNAAVRHKVGDMHEAPVVTASYSDLVRYRYHPFEDVRVEGHFQVYSSRLALHELRVTNTGDAHVVLDVYPILEHDVEGVGMSDDGRAFTFEHMHPPDDWIITHEVPHVEHRQNVYVLDAQPNHAGAYTDLDAEATEDGDPSRSLAAALEDGRLDGVVPDREVRAVAFQKSMRLAPGESERLRLVRGVSDASSSASALRASAEALLDYDVEEGVRENEARYARIPMLAFDDPDREATYWNAFSLLRQVMLPPEGAASYNYFVFSREPTWGWGHGGQVFHESLSMLAYVFMDPEGAMNSQRVYMERQHDDGYINYRTGSYLDETIPTDGERTSSAPWYNWINWELYRQTGDEEFLEDAYASGAAFYAWWMRHRDADGDGLAEWGGHAVLESVRDSQVAIWDEVGWPSEFEAVDLNSMLVVEARSLASMAAALGDSAAAAEWSREADSRTEAVNDTFWDDETGFYYHVDRSDHDFTFDEPDDLKRQEIIGFLPLWAGIATGERAERLIGHLTDSSTFQRPFGVPTLAADDPYYDPMGYWNGPVWIEWQYLIFRGLLDRGDVDLAADLADRVISNVTDRLKSTHTFWELYSPEERRAGHHQTYIWTGLVARMLIDLQEAASESEPGR